MARSRVSRGIEAFFAFSTATRRRAFISGSGPALAATMISFTSLPKMRPRAAAFSVRPLCFHCAPKSFPPDAELAVGQLQLALIALVDERRAEGALVELALLGGQLRELHVARAFEAGALAVPLGEHALPPAAVFLEAQVEIFVL